MCYNVSIASSHQFTWNMFQTSCSNQRIECNSFVSKRSPKILKGCWYLNFIWILYHRRLTGRSVDISKNGTNSSVIDYLSQLMRLWYLSHRRPAKAQASLRIRAVSPEPSLFAHIKYGSRRRVRPKLRQLAPRMRVWRTKSAIISWADSFYEKKKKRMS